MNATLVAAALCCRGIPIEVFTRRERDMPRIIREGLMTIHAVDYESSIQRHPMARDYEEGLSFVEGVLRHPHFWPHRYQCIHTHHWTSGVLLPENLPNETRLIHTPHLLAREKMLKTGAVCPDVALRSEELLLHRSEKIIVVSDDEGSAIRSAFPDLSARLVVVRNGVDPSFLELGTASEFGGAAGKDGIHIVTVGRLCAQKGFDVLLDALELLIKRDFSFRVSIVGGAYGEDGFEQCIRARVHSPPLDGRVRLMGNIEHSAIAPLLTSADIYVQPSRYESQCTALLEAMAAGRAIVASRLGAIEEYVHHGVNGFLVPPGDASILADMLEKVGSRRNSDEIASVNRNARQQASVFSWERTAEETLDVLIGIPSRIDRSPSGESHDGALQSILAQQGLVEAGSLMALPGVRAVFLSGSAARGLVNGSSDLDLHLVVEQRLDSTSLPPWQIGPQGVIRNTHQLGLDVLAEALDNLGDKNAISKFHHETRFGDELREARLLASTLPFHLEDGLVQLQVSRLGQSVIRLLSLAYAEDAMNGSSAATAALDCGAVLDAQQILRFAAQSLLIAALVRRGWTIRGSKKRPEIASEYIADDIVAMVLEALFLSVGLDAVKLADARAICRQRMEVRVLYRAELRALMVDSIQESRDRFGEVLRFVERHDVGAKDYYASLLDSGMYRGPVNHIRSLSGFPRIPGDIAKCVGWNGPFPIQWMAGPESPVSRTFANAWFQTAGLVRGEAECRTLAAQVCEIAGRIFSETGSA